MELAGIQQNIAAQLQSKDDMIRSLQVRFRPLSFAEEN